MWDGMERRDFFVVDTLVLAGTGYDSATCQLKTC